MRARVHIRGRTRGNYLRSALLALTAPRKGLFGAKPPAKTPEYLAALHALGAYSADPRARAIREGAARSRDPEIAAAAGGRTQ